MKKRYTYFLWCICCVVIMNSCVKTDVIDDFTPIEEKWMSVDDFISSSNTSKTFEIPDASKEFIFKMDHGLLKIAAGAIIDATNQPIEGPVTLEYKEIFDYKDLFLNGIHTVDLAGEPTYGRYIVKIALKRGNEQLDIDVFNPISIYYDTNDNSVDFEQVFSWQTDQNDEGWNLAANFDLYEESWDIDYEGENFKGDGYRLLVRSSGFTSIAEIESLKYTNTQDFGIVELSVSDEFKNSETQVYYARKNDFAMVPMYLENGKYKYENVRKGEEVTFFGVTVINEKLYFAKRNIIVGDTNEYTLNFNESSYIQIIEELRNM